MNSRRGVGRRSRLAALTVALALMQAAAAAAQDRMPPIPSHRMTEAQAKAVEAFVAARGAALSGPFVPLLRSPELMERARALGDYVRFKSALTPKMREPVILITARHWTQQYEWHVHHQAAMKAGLDPSVAKAIAGGRRPQRMAEDEAILYDFCIELLRNKQVGDAAYAAAVNRFGEQAVVDAIGTMGYYGLLAMVLNTARTPLPVGASPPLAPLPR